MKSFRLSERANCDLRAIKDYLEQTWKVSAAGTLGRIRKALQKIADQPGLGGRADDIAPGWRIFPVKNWLVIYREESFVVVVSRIVHGSRDLSNLTGLS